jgi:hypothetical protein
MEIVDFCFKFMTESEQIECSACLFMHKSTLALLLEQKGVDISRFIHHENSQIVNCYKILMDCYHQFFVEKKIKERVKDIRENDIISQYLQIAFPNKKFSPESIRYIKMNARKKCSVKDFFELFFPGWGLENFGG